MRLLAAFLFCAGCLSAQPDKNFVYQIFVRSFADSPGDTATDRKEVGDLKGIRENLHYLQRLGVGVIWLMPIFPSGTYHGYDIDDYYAVNPDYGTMEDLDELVRAAHGRGIRVILDIAFNHTSTRHPWFQAALQDPASTEAGYYRLAPDDKSPRPRGWHVQKGVRYLGQFGPDMPDLNLDNPTVRSELKAVAKFWLDRGIDGFRLDAAKHVYDGEPEKNNRWWREFSDYVYSLNPQTLLVGEVLSRPSDLRDHSPGLDALLDAPFLREARRYILQPQGGFLTGWLANLQSYRSARKSDSRRFDTWPFLGSHDETPRLASYLNDLPPNDRAQAYGLGLSLLFAIGKYPVLYNGDELMQPGIKWRGNPPSSPHEPGDGSRIYDETLREPFPWLKDATTARPPQTSWFASRYDKPNDGVSVEERPSTLAAVQALAAFRAKHPSFASSEITAIREDSGEWLIFERGGYLVVINPTKVGKRFEAVQKRSNVRKVFPTSGNARMVPARGMIIYEKVRENRRR